QDRLVVGPRYFQDGQFKENFVVDNLGDVTLAGDLAVAGNFKVQGVAMPVDVVVGTASFTAPSGTSGTANIQMPSRLPNPSSGQIPVSLADIGNLGPAIDAQWSVAAQGGSTKSGNVFTFPINWTLGDTDGELLLISYVAIFFP